jgi:hypothetical protein
VTEQKPVEIDMGMGIPLPQLQTLNANPLSYNKNTSHYRAKKSCKSENDMVKYFNAK